MPSAKTPRRAPVAARPKQASAKTPAKSAKVVAAPRRARAAAADTGRDHEPHGLSLHIGLDTVNPRHYGGWGGTLQGAEVDARALAELSRRRGLEPTLLLGAQATRAKVLAAVRAAAETLRAGDLFVLTYAGHGGQLPDVSGDEADRQDETWCLYDAQLIIKELFYELSRFAADVRQLVVADTCHSGTVTRAFPMVIAGNDPAPEQPRLMPMAVALRTYRDNQSYYDRLQSDLVRAINAGGSADRAEVALLPLSSLTESFLMQRLAGHYAPALVVLAAAQDNQTAMDSAEGGRFTRALLGMLDAEADPGNLPRFMALLRQRMPASQTPALSTMGPVKRFVAQAPWTL